jgi:hypothetical protein
VHLPRESGHTIEAPLRMDNQRVQDILVNPLVVHKINYFAGHDHYVREKIEREKSEVQWRATTQNIADICTAALVAVVYVALRSQLSLQRHEIGNHHVVKAF